MLHFLYITALLIVIASLALMDWRWKVAFFCDWRRTLITIASGIGMFVIWDILGIRLSIFFPGDSRYDLGIMLAPKFPIEELFFLFSFVYLTLLLWRIGGQFVHVSDS